MTYTTRLKPQLCPECGYVADTYTSLQPEPPKEGDYTICFNCGALIVFDADIVQRLATEEERTEFFEQFPLHLLSVDFIKTRGPLREATDGNVQ